jgi:hypothetical protein
MLLSTYAIVAIAFYYFPSPSHPVLNTSAGQLVF